MIFALFANVVWFGSILAGIAVLGILACYVDQSIQDWKSR